MKLEKLIGKPLDGFNIQRTYLIFWAGDDGMKVHDVHCYGCGNKNSVDKFVSEHKEGPWMNISEGIVLTDGKIAFIIHGGGARYSTNHINVLVEK